MISTVLLVLEASWNDIDSVILEALASQHCIDSIDTTLLIVQCIDWILLPMSENFIILKLICPLHISVKLLCTMFVGQV